MHGQINHRVAIATTFPDKSVGTSVVDWFPNACKGLFNGKAGTALHFASGFDERSCQRYAAGHVKPSADFIRALLHSDQGATWLNVIMDGSSAEWWAELQTAREICSRYRIGKK